MTTQPALTTREQALLDAILRHEAQGFDGVVFWAPYADEFIDLRRDGLITGALRKHARWRLTDAGRKAASE